MLTEKIVINEQFQRRIRHGTCLSPATGDGLWLAFRQASFLAAALAADNLQLYEAAHLRISRMPRMMERPLLFMDRNDSFRELVISTLAAQPSTFNHFLAAHMGSLGAANMSLEAARFALRLMYYYGCKDIAHKIAKIFTILTKQSPTAKKSLSADCQETQSAI